MLKVIEEFPDYGITEYGEVFRLSDHKEILRQVSPYGYNVINLHRDGKKYYRRCARLVGFTYLADQYSEGCYINHKDLDKRNDHVSNLEWVTPSGNYQHSFNLQPKMHKGNRLYPESVIRDICRLLEDGYGVHQIPDMIDVPEHLVSDIMHKGSWSWISCEYNIDRRPKILLEDDIFEIFNLGMSGLSSSQIRKMYDHKYRGLTTRVIKNILMRRTFKHITEPLGAGKLPTTS